MDYLLTWYDGEEVNYRFLGAKELKKIRIEEDKPYTLTEIKTGKVIPNVYRFVKQELI